MNNFKVFRILITALLIIAILPFNVFAESGLSNSDNKEMLTVGTTVSAAADEESNSTKYETYKVGSNTLKMYDRIEFGGETWFVLDITGDTAFILSDRSYKCEYDASIHGYSIAKSLMSYYSYGSVTWENSDLRHFLNSRTKPSYTDRIYDYSYYGGGIVDLCWGTDSEPSYKDIDGFLSRFSEKEYKLIEPTTHNNITAITKYPGSTPVYDSQFGKFNNVSDIEALYGGDYPVETTQDFMFPLSGLEIARFTKENGVCFSNGSFWLRDVVSTNLAGYYIYHGMNALAMSSNSYSSTQADNNNKIAPACRIRLDYIDSISGSGTQNNPYKLTINESVLNREYGNGSTAIDVGNLTVNIMAPMSLSLKNNKYLENPFNVIINIDNTKSELEKDVKVEMVSNDEALTLYNSQSNMVTIGDMKKGSSKTCKFNLNADVQENTKTGNYSLNFYINGELVKTVDKSIILYGLKDSQHTDDPTDNQSDANIPIVFIPGVMGSKLYDGDDIIWGTNESVLNCFKNNGYRARIENQLQTSGLTLESSKPEGSREYGTTDICKNMIDFLCDTYPNRNIYFYSYDWRQSNVDSAKKLNQSLKAAGIDRAIFVCHSMGGLVISQYLELSKQECEIEKVITLGTPYEGAPKLLYSVLTCEVLSGVASIGNLTLLLGGLSYDIKRNFPGVAELSPSIEYVNGYKNRINCFNRIVDSSNMFEVTLNFVTNIRAKNLTELKKWATTSSVNNNEKDLKYSVLKWIENTEKIYSKKGLTLRDVEVVSSTNRLVIYPIYLEKISYSESLSKIFGSNYNEMLAELQYTQQAINKLLNMKNAYFAISSSKNTISGMDIVLNEDGSGYIEDISYGEGDGTVPYESANMLTNYCSNNMAYFDLNHTELSGKASGAEWDKEKKWIKSVIDGDNVIGNNTYKKSNGRVVVKVHCPVDVTIKCGDEVLDSEDGNSIYESSFGRMDIIGKDNDVKVFALSPDNNYSVTIVGTGDGTVDYSVAEYNDDGSISDERKFNNIAVQEGSIIKTNITESEQMVLYVDSDGDGTTDSTWTASKNETVMESDNQNPFTDVLESDYFYNSVLWAVGKGITNGTSDTTFSPNVTCTRAQAVTFLWRAEGCPKANTKNNPFVDVYSSDYYYDAVIWAVENGITAGTSDTTFSPYETCSRGQIVTFLYRTSGESYSKTNNKFTDVKKTDYYCIPVSWAVAREITAGTSNTTFSPENYCTRGQIVTFLYRYKNQ